MLIENIKKKVLCSLLFGGDTHNERGKLTRRMQRDDKGEYLANFNDEQIDKLIKYIEVDYFKLKHIKHARAINKLNDGK